MDDRLEVAAETVARLVAAQFPALAGLPVRPVVPGGWDNRSFRLGERFSVRMPSAARYAGQPGKEVRWLPHLAPHLPVAVPRPVGLGAPGEGYPYAWSVMEWLPGAALGPPPEGSAPADEMSQTIGAGAGPSGRRGGTGGGPVDLGPGLDAPDGARRRVAPAIDAGGSTASGPDGGDAFGVRMARDLGAVLRALRAAPAAGGPPAGRQNFWRGGDLGIYAGEVAAALDRLGPAVDRAWAQAVWDRARASRWERPGVWVHGDVAAGNLLVRDGRLTALIDFGSLGVGDPACDLTMAWTWFDRGAAAAFREAAGLDPATWDRAAGWALWKALIVLAADPGDPGARRTLRALRADASGDAPT